MVGLSARKQELVSARVGVPGLVKDPNCKEKETVYVAGGFGPDGLKPPARGAFIHCSGSSVPDSDGGDEDGLNDGIVEVHHYCLG